MAGDPSGLAGAAIGDLMRRVVDRLEKAIEWAEYCRQLKQLLQSMGPLVAEICSQEAQDSVHASSPTRVWLLNLKNCLLEAGSVLEQCSDPKYRWNPIARLSCGSKLCRTTERIKDLLRTQTVVPIVGLLMTHMSATDGALTDLKQELARLNLGLEGQKLLTTSVVDKDHTVYMLSKALERLGFMHPGSSTLSSPNETSSTEEFNDEDLEIQSIPQLVFGMDTLNQQMQGVLMDSEHIVANDRDSNVELHRDSKWVGVWAKGGAGKTLLVQNAMNNPVVTAHFNNRVYAVVVGQSPDLINLQRILCQKIDRNLTREISSLAKGKARLLKLLRGQRCLLILDDVWREEHLEWFDVVSEGGARILITSRNQSVLQRVQATELFVLELSDENSMKLFCVHAFGGVERMPGPLENLVKDVVKECKGLPLALKVVGGALAGKMESHLWEMALYNLRQAEVLGKGYEEKLFRRLKLSYDDLGTLEQEGRVYKECFLYFVAFPEDAVIEAEHLIQLWVGDGLIGQREGLDPDIEAYCILSVLLGRSLIELVEESVAFHTKFKIHDVLRDMGLYILSCGTQPWEQKCLFKAGWQPADAGSTQEVLPQGWLSFEDGSDRGQRDTGGCNIMQAKKLSLMNSSVSSLPSKMNAKRLSPPLQVLLLCQCDRLKELDGSFLGYFTNLRVLDLSYTSISSLPSAIGKLAELVVLNLDSSSIDCLTSEIGNLRKLQSLNLNNCEYLSTLPASDFVSKLVSLKYLSTWRSALRWGTANGMQRKPMFSRISSGFNRNCRLEALNRLVHLRKLCIGGDDVELFPDNSMSKLSRLKGLSLRFPKLKELPGGMRNLFAMEVLVLNKCKNLKRLPDWALESMAQLKTVDLSSCEGLSQIPSKLCTLQLLIKLDLTWCKSLQHLPDEFGRPGSFPSLQELLLRWCDRLQAFPELQMGAFPRLLSLDLNDCSSLQRLPESISLVGRHLRTLNLGGCRRLAMPSDQTLSAFVKLEKLSLEGLPIDVLPSAVASLPSLKTLNISGCSALKTLPEPVSGNEDMSSSSFFPNLQILDANNCTALTNIPVGITELPKLRMCLGVRQPDAD